MPPPVPRPGAAPESAAEPVVGRAAVALLAYLTLLNVLNFVDRTLIGSLGPLLIADLGLSRTELGLLAGFRETLEQGRRAARPPGPLAPTADLPALREQQRLDEFVACRFPRLRRLRRQGVTMHRDAYHQAIAAGRELTLHRTVAEEGTPIRLLP